MSLSLDKLMIPPDENGYSITENSGGLIEVVLDGGSPRTRLDELDGSRTITLQWSGRPQRWKTVNDFFRKNMGRNYEPFLLDLIIATAEYQEYTCNLIPDSIKTSTPEGIAWIIQAQLEVQSDDDELTDWPT